MELQVSYDKDFPWPTEYYDSFYIRVFNNPSFWTAHLILRIKEMKNWYDKELEKSRKKNEEEKRKRDLENFAD